MTSPFWPLVVVLSGPLYSGKTTLAIRLHSELRFEVLQGREVLRQLAGRGSYSREELQRLGAELDHRTGGQWLVEALQESRKRVAATWVVDSARTVRQVKALRTGVGDAFVVHLTASITERERRFTKAHLLGEPASFREATSPTVEMEAEDTSTVSDLIIDSTALVPSEVFAATVTRLGSWRR